MIRYEFPLLNFPSQMKTGIPLNDGFYLTEI